jgi:hypothetical protein
VNPAIPDVVVSRGRCPQSGVIIKANKLIGRKIKLVKVTGYGIRMVIENAVIEIFAPTNVETITEPSSAILESARGGVLGPIRMGVYGPDGTKYNISVVVQAQISGTETLNLCFLFKPIPGFQFEIWDNVVGQNQMNQMRQTRQIGNNDLVKSMEEV